MKQLIIIGASAMGREAFFYAREMSPGFNIKGFLDSRKDILSNYEGYPPVIGDLWSYHIQKDDVFVCAVGDPDAKMAYVKAIEEQGGEFVSIIHPTAYVAPNAKIGEGSIIAPNSCVSADVTIGDHTIINVNASVSHDCVIGCGSSISPGCSIAGWCKIGERAFLGTGAVVIPHIVLGNEGKVFVAAGATVTRSFGKGLIAGVPAELKRKI